MECEVRIHDYREIVERERVLMHVILRIIHLSLWERISDEILFSIFIFFLRSSNYLEEVRIIIWRIEEVRRED